MSKSLIQNRITRPAGGGGDGPYVINQTYFLEESITENGSQCALRFPNRTQV